MAALALGPEASLHWECTKWALQARHFQHPPSHQWLSSPLTWHQGGLISIKAPWWSVRKSFVMTGVMDLIDWLGTTYPLPPFQLQHGTTHVAFVRVGIPVLSGNVRSHVDTTEKRTLIISIAQSEEVRFDSLFGRQLGWSSTGHVYACVTTCG